ncbi:uncharacterized protein Smp_201000 [Schistosoma mansoni]|uniref:Smp_201000 n=1 Tax=Schistosoma mansoni TaxID=6183 RepID=G4V650_SCHMA|nr:uncharacterized protein Smp_201000 [Schistosoma mansoni]|eukprot:XP_018648605.1 uncharacterized protein Smp_201000 [Schistosoma mansoni]
MKFTLYSTSSADHNQTNMKNLKPLNSCFVIVWNFLELHICDSIGGRTQDIGVLKRVINALIIESYPIVYISSCIY